MARKWPIAALGVITATGLVLAMYGALVWAPTEATMGDIQRIFYVHLPSFLTSFLAYFLVFIGSVGYLITKDFKWDRLGLACAEIGTLFCTEGLITGPIWAKPVWGIWWTWDARLTTTLILWLLYVAYLLLRDFMEEPARRATLAAVFGIFAFVDVPIVYFSIRIFRTQHPQPVLLGGQNSGLDPSMNKVFLVSWLAFTLLFVLLLRLRMRLEENRSELQQLRRRWMLQ